jgi:hypothetical protein
MIRAAALALALTILALTILALTGAFTSPSNAKDPGDDGWFMRMLVCHAEGTMIELYLPQSIVFGKKPLAQALARPVIGYYTLDLSDINKGKPLEPVKVSMTADGKTVIVNQYTRGLPPTRIPVEGGTVDFDHRFGEQAKCDPFRPQDPNYGG